MRPAARCAHFWKPPNAAAAKGRKASIQETQYEICLGQLWKSHCAGSCLFQQMLSKSVGLQTCGRLSEGSSRATNFYELEVQVKGASLLEESLVGANHLLLEPRGFSFH